MQHTSLQVAPALKCRADRRSPFQGLAAAILRDQAVQGTKIVMGIVVTYLDGERIVSFWRCQYHIIWATRERIPTITSERESIVAACIHAVGQRDDIQVHAVGVMPDHVHVVLSVPPRYALANVVKNMKGLSSRTVAEKAGTAPPAWTGWQAEYAVLTFGEASFDRIVAYVQNQSRHHAHDDLWAYLEQVVPIDTSINARPSP